MKRTTVVLLAIAVASPPAVRGDEPPAERPYWRRNLFRRVAGDQKFLVSTWLPAESRRSTFMVPLVTALAGATGSSRGDRNFDIQWQGAAEGWTTGGRRDAAEAVSILGDRNAAIVLIGSTYLIARLAGNERMQEVTSLSAEALASSALYATLLKRISRRTRPAAAGTGEFFVNSPVAGQESDSFPSGHAMGAFTVATVIAEECSEKRWVSWLAYGTASVIALSRVGLGRHFPTDVAAGAILGHSMGRMVIRRNGGPERSNPWSRIEPLYDPENEGLGIAYRHTW